MHSTSKKQFNVNLFSIISTRTSVNMTSAAKSTNRELKHQASVLSRRPTGSKMSVDVAYLYTPCGRGDRHGGRQAAFQLRVDLSKPRGCFVKDWLQAPNKTSINFCK